GNAVRRFLSHRHTIHGLWRHRRLSTFADLHHLPEPHAGSFAERSRLGDRSFHGLFARLRQSLLWIVVGKADLPTLIDAELDRAVQDRTDLGDIADFDGQCVGHFVAHHLWRFDRAVFLWLRVPVL